MQVYVTRHGQTQWNALDKVLGRTDVPLDETGLAQAKALAESLRGEPIDLVITSPLTRTVQTGRCAAEALGVPAVTADALIEMDFGIFEGVQRGDETYQMEKKRYFARLAGGESFLDLAGRVYPFLQSLPELTAQILREQGGSRGDAGPAAAGVDAADGAAERAPASAGVEVTDAAAAVKAGSAAASAAKDRTGGAAAPPRDPNVLLVSHNGICRVICSYFRDMENDEFRTFQLGNCAVMRFEL